MIFEGGLEFFDPDLDEIGEDQENMDDKTKNNNENLEEFVVSKVTIWDKIV